MSTTSIDEKMDCLPLSLLQITHAAWPDDFVMCAHARTYSGGT